jgi:hypothetical protein
MPIYSLDGNSIFEVAKRFERLGIQQLKQNPQETINRIKSGQDTGSSKFLSDFNNLYGLANQLKVKTSLQQTDSSIINQQLESEFIQYKIDNREDKKRAEDELWEEIQYQNLIDSKDTIESRLQMVNSLPDLMERRFLVEVFLDVWTKKYTGISRGSTYKEYLRETLQFIKNEQLELRIGSPDVSQQKLLYNTLSKVDSSIANLIQQMTPLTESLYNSFKSKLSTWTSEINSNLQDALKDDARTVRENLSQVSASSEIGNYKEVFERLNKRYNELNLLIQNIGGSATGDRAVVNLNPAEP